MVPKIKAGSYTGTGAAQNISLGWVPDFVRVDADGAGAAVDFYNGQTGGDITAFAGSVTQSAGFTAAVGQSTDTTVYRYVAMATGS